MVFLNGTGTHKGEFDGISPTNKPVNIRSEEPVNIENEMITGHWDTVDLLNLLEQVHYFLIMQTRNLRMQGWYGFVNMNEVSRST